MIRRILGGFLLRAELTGLACFVGARLKPRHEGVAVSAKDPRPELVVEDGVAPEETFAGVSPRVEEAGPPPVYGEPGVCQGRRPVATAAGGVAAFGGIGAVDVDLQGARSHGVERASGRGEAEVVEDRGAR